MHFSSKVEPIHLKITQNHTKQSECEHLSFPQLLSLVFLDLFPCFSKASDSSLSPGPVINCPEEKIK